MRRSPVVLALLIAAALLAPPAHAAYNLAAQPPTGLASRAEQIASADFDGDGDLDLAGAVCGASCGGSGTGNVTVMQNNGAGTFTTTTLTAGTGPQVIVARDFSGDGDADIAVGNAGSQTVSVFTGNGNGTFAAPVTTSLTGTPRGIDLADTDGDGDRDLIVALAPAANQVHVLENTGSFNFLPSQTLSGPIDARGVIARDFDGDGDPDIAAILGSSGRLIVFTNSGGVYGSAKLEGIGGTPAGFTAGDFNGDNDLDIAVAAQSTSVAVLLGSTGTTFADGAYHAESPGLGQTLGIATRDMDGDGDRDLVTRNTGASVGILDGKGDGTFAAAGSATAVNQGTPGSSSVVLGDLTGDGFPDAAVPNAGAASVSALKAIGVLTPQPDSDFDDQQVGGRGDTRAFTIANTGTGPATLGAPSLSGANAADFQVVRDCSARVLAPGASCEHLVRFAPLATGGRSATLSVAQADAPAALAGFSLFGLGTSPPVPVVGPTGPQGPAGASGSNGTNGATGPQGPSGTNGTNGLNGAVGPQGATGPQGRPGRDATVTCRPQGTKKVKVTCTVKLASARTTSLRLLRGRTLYASGRVTKSGAARLKRTRALTPGRYTLEVRSGGKTTRQVVRL